MTDYSNPSEVEWAEHLDRIAEDQDEHRFVADVPPPVFRWRGVDAAGNPRTGFRHDPDIEAMVQNRFKAGWRSLTVTRDGEQVGAIGPNPNTGHRTWWAEG